MQNGLQSGEDNASMDASLGGRVPAAELEVVAGAAGGGGRDASAAESAAQSSSLF